ncbi:MAG: S16 family serine protease [Thermoproteota archaeon]
MNKQLAVAITLLALLVPTAFTATAAGSGRHAYLWMSSAEVVVPAVSVESGRYIGVASKLRVVVAWPGSGNVYLSVTPLAELDMQASARLAALVAASLAGVDFSSFDYFIELNASTSIVGGPSASGAMTVALLAALNGASIPANFSMTGMISPDLGLGPVGGIPEKLRAAADAGAKIFVIPFGQRYALDPNLNAVVDVGDIGRDLGVRVVEAATVLEAYTYATGDTTYGRVVSAENINVTYPQWFFDVFKEAAERLSQLAEGNVSCIKEYGPRLPSGVRELVDGYLAAAIRALNSSSSQMSAGALYAAASSSFYAAYTASAGCIMARILSSEDPLETLRQVARQYLEASKSLVAAASAKLDDLASGDLGPGSLQVAIVAANRVWDANSSVEALEELADILAAAPRLSLQDLESVALRISYTYYRSMSALDWLSALRKSVEAEDGGGVDFSLLRNAAEILAYYARSSLDYLSALGISVPEDLVLLAEEAQRMVREASGPAQLIAGLVRTLEVLSRVNAATRTAFALNASSAVEASRRSAITMIQLVSEKGFNPVVPAIYLENAEHREDVEAKLSMYASSSAYSLLLLMLSPSQKMPKWGEILPVTVTETVTNTVTETTTVTETVTLTVTQRVTSTATHMLTTTSTVTMTQSVTQAPSRDGLLAGAAMAGLLVGLGISVLLTRGSRRGG